jgi:hypothetical protein
MLPPEMGLAIVAAAVLLVSGLVALGVVWLPFIGLRRRPRASIRVSIAGAAVAAAAFGIQVAAPLAHGWPVAGWPWLLTDYFLAMAHFFSRDFPYSFFWSPAWEYNVGTLTPLIAAGGVVAAAAGLPALRAGRRGALVSMQVGFGAIALYVGGAAYAAGRRGLASWARSDAAPRPTSNARERHGQRTWLEIEVTSLVRRRGVEPPRPCGH